MPFSHFVAMATSILLTLAFSKPLSDCWKRAFHSTSFIFHGQINADTFFIGWLDAYYICNLNSSEFVFRMQLHHASYEVVFGIYPFFFHFFFFIFFLTNSKAESSQSLFTRTFKATTAD